ncbi:ArsR/SmtB family transcription factor [Actinomadura sp. 6N118]|uniref:ArsR/SmtB family transcription factor n=1 Tax=Actinomadura sp. 6N118 TaxID=3375151 RepID=UPI00378843BB
MLYPARGRATAWESEPAPAPEALAGILGEVRARLLAHLATPATTSDLAAEFGVTPGAISQHLKALYAARLLNRSREGRHVLYFRSPLGDHLAGA